MKFTPRQVVTMVVALACAAVLTPVGVMAATGSLVNIVDPGDTNRRATVTSRGGLVVESRSELPAYVFGNYWSANNLTYFKLAEAVGPQRIAITEVTVGSHGPISGAQYGHNYVDLVRYTQVSGTAACGVPSAYVDYSTPPGYTKKVLRRFVVRNQEQTIQIRWDDPALMSPAAAAGKKSCVQLQVSLLSTETTIFLGGSGYLFH